MLIRASRLTGMLGSALEASDHPPVSWLVSPPPELRRMRAATVVGRAASFSRCRDALFDWQLHRRAGLTIASDGPVRLGATVVIALRLGPLWQPAPCRVVEVIDDPDGSGFAYATLPGHPEQGVERFVFRREGDDLRFEIDAVSRPAGRLARWVPGATSAVQRRVTDRYLAAAAKL